MKPSVLICIALGLLLLILPVTTFVSMLGKPWESLESGFLLAGAMCGVLLVGNWIVVRLFISSGDGVMPFLVTSLALVVLAEVLTVFVAFVIDAVDSSHGGSLVIPVLFGAGTALLLSARLSYAREKTAINGSSR